MRIKSSELTGPALDWAVIVANGQDAAYWLELYLAEDRRVFCARPSTEWLQAGPIIERERIAIDYYEDGSYPNGGMWLGVITREVPGGIEQIGGEGPTPLIAAMRCFVSSKLGEEVEVPDEIA